MSKDLYFILLEKAEKRGLYNVLDVSKTVRKFLKQSPWVEMKPEKWYDVPIILLRPLLDKDYINCVVGEQGIKNPVPENWIDKLEIGICIKPEGILFLFEKRKIRQQSITNRLTFSFIVVTVLIGLWSLYFQSQSVSDKKIIERQSSYILRLKQDSIKASQLLHKYQAIHP